MFITAIRVPSSGPALATTTVLGTALLALSACSGQSAAPSTAATGPVATRSASPTAPSPTPTAATASATPVAATTQPAVRPATATQVKALFVTLVEKHCGPAYMKGTSNPTNPKTATVRQGPSTKEWLVTDRAGHKMVINTSTRHVYSTDGPKGQLPAEYTFGCDEDVFQGTWD